MWTLAELLEQLGHRQLDLERAAGGLKTLASVVPVVVDDLPPDLQRVLDRVAGRTEALSLEVMGLRWRLTDEVASRPPRPDLVVVPDADTQGLERRVADGARELREASVCMPSSAFLRLLEEDLAKAGVSPSTLQTVRELATSLDGVRERLASADVALQPTRRESLLAALVNCGVCGRALLVDPVELDRCSGCMQPEDDCTCTPTSGRYEHTATAAHLGDGPKREPRRPEPTPSTPPVTSPRPEGAEGLEDAHGEKAVR
jgi:hypothetical protein